MLRSPSHVRRNVQPSLSVVIPTLEERGNVAETLARLPAVGARTEVIFVDGGSTDRTADEVRLHRHQRSDLTVRLLHQTGTEGKAAAVRQGFAEAVGEVLMILDGDLSVDPEAVEDVYRAAVDQPGALVVGSRFLLRRDRGSMPWANAVANRLFARLLSVLLGIRLTDALCGTKCFHARHCDVLLQSGGRVADPFGDFALLVAAARAGLPVVEVPVHYRARRYGVSKTRPLRDGWRLLRYLVHATR